MFCPVCTVAVGTGLGISRLLGIDDTVTGIWIGGLIFSSGLWLATLIGKKTFSVILFYVLVLLPLYWAKIIRVPGNTLWGVDRVLLGIVVGSLTFLLSLASDRWLRLSNHGKVHIHFQKVILPIIYLLIVSFIFYLITSKI